MHFLNTNQGHLISCEERTPRIAQPPGWDHRIKEREGNTGTHTA